MLPLTKMGFIGSLAEAAKSCLRGVIAAFGLAELHWGVYSSERLYLHYAASSKASIFVRKTLLVRPEISNDANASFKIAG